MKKRDSRLWYALALAAMGAVLAVRALYGFCWSDESFYLTFAQRLWNGQKLILDEWHPVQFYSVLFYPILSLYRALCGTTGIYLFAREVYVAAALATALFLFFTLCRGCKPLTAFLCAALYLSYSRGNIWGVSYYNLFLTLCLLFACLTARGREGEKKPNLLAGVCLAGAVLCVPYFALFVVPGLIAGLCVRKTRKSALWNALGVCLLAAVFLIFFLPRDIPAVLANLKEILSDPEHTGGPLTYLLVAIRDVKLLYFYEALLSLFAGAVLLLGVKLLPKRFGALPGLLIAACGAAVSLRRYWPGETGFAFYQFALFCLPAMLLCWVRREIKRPALLLRVLGILMALAMGLSSNTEAITFTVGLPVYAMGVLMQLDGLSGEGEMAIRIFGAVLACAVLCVTYGTRITSVFRDGPLNTLTETMASGPAAGIRTTQAHAGQYQQILAMLEELEGEYGSENPIFFTKLLPWGYLAADFPCGAPTAWRTALDSQRLPDYYAAHPDSIPAIVVVLGDDIGDYPGAPAPNENTRSGWLWDYMEQNGYRCREYACGDVYVSPRAN